MRRRNAEKLIKAGAVVTIGTDNYWAAAPEFTRGGTKPDTQNHGIGSIIAIEGLVELGMTPAQAIVAATKNGAIASKQLEHLGTIEAGKLADLLILDANPLSEIAQPSQAAHGDAERHDRSIAAACPRHASCRDEPRTHRAAADPAAVESRHQPRHAAASR